MRSIQTSLMLLAVMGAALAGPPAQAAGTQQRAWVSAAKGLDQTGCGPATSPAEPSNMPSPMRWRRAG